MSLPAHFALRKARGRGERVGVINTVTLTGNYVGGGIAVTDNILTRIDYAQATLYSGYGAASGAPTTSVQAFAGQGNNTFKAGLLNYISGAVASGTVEIVSGVSISGTQISYLAIGE